MFQNYIIYMPYLPPGSRRAKISTYDLDCAGVKWEEFVTPSSDGTAISLCVARETSLEGMEAKYPPIYILYCQGNGSSLPPRLKYLSSVLQQVRAESRLAADVTIVAVSYRGYWKSKGRPSEQGINHDVKAALRWVSELHERKIRFAQGTLTHPAYSEGPAAEKLGHPTVILWGQSIGCGFTTNLAAAAVEEDGVDASWIIPDALVLETPFLSMRDMLAVLYPMKWIPYRYLGPFLRNFLDSYSNLGLIARKCKVMFPGRSLPGVYIIDAGKDELVPREHAEVLVHRCNELGIPVKRTCIKLASHNEVGILEAGREAIAAAICDAITKVEARTRLRGPSAHSA